MTTSDTNSSDALDEILECIVDDWHGFREEAIANLPENTRKFVDDASWAGEELKAERIRLAKQAINQHYKKLLMARTVQYDLGSYSGGTGTNQVFEAIPLSAIEDIFKGGDES